MPTSRIVLFDGVCNFCNSSVQFVIDRDPAGLFRFAPLQSPLGQKLCQRFDLTRQRIDSVVLVEDDRVYMQSTAALRIARQLRAPWFMVSLFIMIPPLLRDLAYDWVARHRYRWFGRLESCRMPTPEFRARFLDDANPETQP
jgi:predicted DCC family thiol-disulfide oxidoreductase YuxK